MDEEQVSFTHTLQTDLTEAVRATALLADLTIATWSGERTDRSLGEQIKQDAGAVGNTGRYLKNLLAGCDNTLKDLKSSFQAARALHYQLTLPWVNNPSAERQAGPRLLPNMIFMDYMKRMSALKREAMHKLDAFVDEYPDLCSRAQANLAGLAKPEDYPDQDTIRGAFHLTFDFLPIPESAGAFTGLSGVIPDAAITKLGAALKQRQERSVSIAQGAMWDRVKSSIDHLIERLDDPDKLFKVNTIDAVHELVTLLPGFNCAGDPRVTTVVEDIQRMLDGTSADMMRKNLDVRADVVRQAKDINDKLTQWGI